MSRLAPRTFELDDVRVTARAADGDDPHGRAVLVAAEDFAAAERLLGPTLAAGLTVVVPDLAALDGAARFAEWSDRASLARLDALADALVAEGAAADGLALVGVGDAAPLAWLGGCTSTRFAAIASLGAAPVYAGLSERKPMQPLEMTLNLDRALLLALDAEHEHAALVRDLLEQGAKDYEWLAPGADVAVELARFLDERL